MQTSPTRRALLSLRRGRKRLIRDFRWLSAGRMLQVAGATAAQQIHAAFAVRPDAAG